jgi:hypothetical protein
MRSLLTILLICTSTALVSAQTGAPVCRQVKVQPVTKLDSLTVVPESLIIIAGRDTLATSYYKLQSGDLHFTTSDVDSVTVCYQTLPYHLGKSYYRRSLADYMEARRQYRLPATEQVTLGYDKREELFPTGNIRKSGSLGRSVSFGNAQSAVVNSTLNLQIEGALTDNLNIRASITDQDIPFQPEGNTAQVQDFDNIFIELYNDHFSLTAGDILLKNPSSAFLRYHKNVQGGLLTTRYALGGGHAETTLAISQAKGKFASILLDVQEGVLGPYRIKVPRADDFIIVLANSEKVYLDGELLSRGFDQDYIIDYNKAEIQFTAEVLITKYSRVRIDLEYSDRNYSRSIVAAGHQQRVGKFGLFANYYTEKDNPNQPLSFELSDADRQLMQDVGDSLQSAYTLAAQQVPYNADYVLYEQVDTLDDQLQQTTIFRYSTNAQATLYRVTFTHVGQGRGDYILRQSTVNGRIYEWVPPREGRPQGDSAPVRQLTAPNKRHMFTTGASYAISDHDELYAELAFSDNDQNLLSTLDGHDDTGRAYKVGYRAAPRAVTFLEDYHFSAAADFEYNSAYFAPIDRYRSIEFDRDWNFNPDDDSEQAADHILNVETTLERNQDNRMYYRLSKRKRGAAVDGLQHEATLNKSIGPLQWRTQAFTMNSRAALHDARWHRINADVFLRAGYFAPGYRYSADRNELTMPDSDSIVSTAMNFAQHTFYINSGDSLNTSFGLSYALREDRTPHAGELTTSDRSATTQLYFQLPERGGQRLRLTAIHRRNLNYSWDAQGKMEETVQGKLDWYSTLLKRHVRSDLSYMVGSGRELKREYVYVQVATGEGTHTWRDDNGDGLQELGEFYLAVNFDERNYIKILLPTNEFVSAYESNLNYRLALEMPRAWAQGTGIRSFLSRFSNNTAISAVRKVTDGRLAARLMPLLSHVDDEGLLSLRQSVRSTFMYNRSNSHFGAEFGLWQTGSRQLMTGGFEDRRMQQYFSNIRVMFNAVHSGRLGISSTKTSSASNFLQGRTFVVHERKVAPELAWQPNSFVRITTQYGYTQKQNAAQTENAEKARLQELGVQSRISRSSDFSLQSMVRYLHIQYDGKENTPLAYEMLEALRPGSNINWNISLQKKLFDGLQLSVGYEGRKSQQSAAVHTGHMQVSALF